MRLQRGSASIEYIVTLLPFMVMVLVVIEVCRFIMTASVLDAALASASRDIVTVRAHQDTVTELQSALQAQSLPLIDRSQLTIEAAYYESFKALKQNQYITTYREQPFAEYRVTYPYRVLFIEGWSDAFGQLARFERTLLIAHEKESRP
ncbi:TadE/TadG family type IV pilus assembly protein [Photobacterium sp. TY1-4]|uniref:TadE/TadG family type IV pilus assembly protein n=1 Tax=Photobacterium sp. TY1-4 TaxID=2899122 RepID=UPI0021BE5180|nr:TadE family protein [Photobacterium sp. TY1-4]UXI03631.1 pilus assembly protein [Photobacterium sp. TY1-4]